MGVVSSRATGQLGYLDKGRRPLLGPLDHAPARFRESVLANAPLHRAILAAAES